VKNIYLYKIVRPRRRMSHLDFSRSPLLFHMMTTYAYIR